MIFGRVKARKKEKYDVSICAFNRATMCNLAYNMQLIFNRLASLYDIPSKQQSIDLTNSD
jgi:hypothetical protein